MEKTIDLKLTAENKELIILTGAAEPVYHNKSLDVNLGSINSALEYLSKKSCED